MNERWERIEGLYHAARKLDGDEQARFLDEACRSDAEMRRQIDALLKQGREQSSFLNAPAVEFATQHTPGSSLPPRTRIGPYEIVGVIGRGGMGEVYRARDSKLERDVAIKVLPGTFARDSNRVSRFAREARVLASLNHPNIAAIYGVGEFSGAPGLILELVEGPTLLDLLARGRLPLDDALTAGRQIAEAIEAAHEKRILHRDLKPANIKIRADGVVKVLDFGLAKAFAGDSPPLDMSRSPSVTADGTETGVILGTPAYMSPEQARGKELDKRTDIWAFGCLLYEMLTGRSAFVGDTVSDVIAAVLDRNPNWEILPDGTPPAIRQLLKRCLEKDSRHRLRDIGDARIEIEAVVAAPEPAERYPHAGDPAPGARRLSTRWLLTLISVSAAAGVILWLRPNAPSREPIQFTFEPPENATLLREGLDAAVSPNGRRIAFIAQLTSGTRAIWVRSLDTQEAVRIAGTDGATNPFWSADGEFLGFFAEGKLKKLALSGGPPQNICNTTPGLGATWNSAGVIVFNPTNRAALMRVSASGGSPVQLTTLDSGRQENSHRWPAFLPDGRHFVFTARSSLKENTAIYVGSLDSNEPKRLLTEQSNAVYSPPGYLLFGREGTLMAQRFDPNKLELSGSPFPIAGNIDQETPSANAFFSVSADGSVIAYHEASRAMDQLTWFGRDGSVKGVVGSKGLYGQPRLSPDGKRLAVHIPDPVSGNRDIWIINLENAVQTRFTSNPANDWFPVWSPDGADLAFVSDRTVPPSIYRKALRGDSQEELLWTSEASVTDWSPDGKYLLVNNGAFGRAQTSDLSLLAVSGDHKPRPVFMSEFSKFNGAFSPDGKWVAYDSNESGAAQVYIRSIEKPEKQQVSANGGSHPRWRGDGKEIFYVTRDNKMMSADVRLGESLSVSAPRLLFPVCNASRSDSIFPDYEVAPDGKGFLSSCQQEVKKRAITVAVQWTSLVKYSGGGSNSP